MPPEDKSFVNARRRLRQLFGANEIVVAQSRRAVCAKNNLASIPAKHHFRMMIVRIGNAANSALEYILVIFFAAPIFLLLFVFGGALQAAGDTRAYRNSVIGAAILNIALDPILMFGWFGLPKLGVAGVALATVISTALSAAYLFWVLTRTGLAHRWRHFFLRPQFAKLWQLLADAATPTARMFAIGAGFFITTGFLGVLDSAAVAAYGIALRVEQLFLLPLIGMEMAMLAFAGQNFGAQKPARVSEAVRLITRAGFAFTAIGALILIFGGGLLMAAFNNDGDVISYGIYYLYVAAAAGPLYFMMNIGGAVLLAGRRAKPIFIASIIRLLILPPLLFWFFALHLQMGVSGVWLGVWLAQIFPALWLRRQSFRLLSDCETPPK